LFWLVAIIVLSQFLISKLSLAVVLKTAAIGTEKIMWIFIVFQWASLQLRRADCGDRWSAVNRKNWHPNKGTRIWRL